MSDQFSLEYQFTNKLCVIISQEIDRPGGERDRERLQLLFTNLEFEVKTIINPKIDNFQTELNKTKTMCEEGDFGLLVVFVLSHGIDENVEVIDGVKTEIKDIISNFMVEKLNTKPKLFIFQTCRGAIFEKGDVLNDVLNESGEEYVDVDENECGEEYVDVVEIECGEKYVDVVRNKWREDYVDVVENESGKGVCREVPQPDLSKLPIDADTLVSHSSIPGCKALRNESLGSYFIYLIYQVFIAHAAKLDVTTMLTLVNRLAAKKLMWKDKNTKKIIMQMPSFKSKLTKKVFLTKKEFPLKYGPLYKVDVFSMYKDMEMSRLYKLANRCKLTKDDLIYNALDYQLKDYTGLCLIFGKRTNTRKDIENLEKLFPSTLGFYQTNVIDNDILDKNGILDILTEVMANKELMTRITNFVVIILTHGDNNKLWAENENFADELVLLIKSCTEIREIPKLFFIQADGFDFDKALECRNKGKEERKLEFQTHDGKHLPSEANMFFMCSNVPANNDEEETPLIKHFYNEVHAGYSNNDLLSIATVVNRKISEEITKTTKVKEQSDGKEKMSYFISQLIGKVFLGRNSNSFQP